MTVQKSRIFNLILAGLVIAAPALAADTSKDDDKRITSSKRLECADGSCKQSKSKFSDEQIEKMISLKNQFLDSTATKRTEMETAQRQLRDLFRADNIDRSKALELQNKIDGLRADISRARLNLKLDQISLLTPEQRQDMKHKMLRGGFGGHGGPGGHHRFGGPRHHMGGPGHGGHGGAQIGAKPQEKA